jgi:transposase InsO family protein
MQKAPSRRPQGRTKADTAAQKAKSLIRRNFTAATPNQKQLTDIPQIPCRAHGMILHSDRGSQFTSSNSWNALELQDPKHERHGPLLNARVKSFFATLKKGKLH